MAQKGIWRDNRSGIAGQIAGNLVLNDIARRSGDTILCRNHTGKGAIFITRKVIYVGRTCGTADYLARAEAHWSNLSPHQFSEITKVARQEERELVFLLITATPGEVHYWCVPGRVIGGILPLLRIKPSDKSCFLRIRKDGHKFLMEDEDVSIYHRSLKPEAAVVAELSMALSRSRKTHKKPKNAGGQDRTQLQQPADLRLQRIFKHGDELAVVLPRDVVARGNVVAGSLVQATMSDGAIQLRPVEVVPKLTDEDARFVDEIYRRRRDVFKALGE